MINAGLTAFWEGLQIYHNSPYSGIKKEAKAPFLPFIIAI